jgi:spore photoproduct lyase
MQADLFLPVLNAPAPALPLAAPMEATPRAHGAKLWLPKRVLFTPAALDEAYGQQILARATALNLDIELLKSYRLTGLRGPDERATYRTAKPTLAVVNAPAGALRLQPTPPRPTPAQPGRGLPAHCQYCGSLSSPPVVCAFTNLPWLLENTQAYDRPVNCEASCYTDVLSIEHLTGALAETVRYFAAREGVGCAS